MSELDDLFKKIIEEKKPDVNWVTEKLKNPEFAKIFLLIYLVCKENPPLYLNILRGLHLDRHEIYEIIDWFEFNGFIIPIFFKDKTGKIISKRIQCYDGVKDDNGNLRMEQFINIVRETIKEKEGND